MEYEIVYVINELNTYETTITSLEIFIFLTIEELLIIQEPPPTIMELRNENGNIPEQRYIQ